MRAVSQFSWKGLKMAAERPDERDERGIDLEEKGNRNLEQMCLNLTEKVE